jgi:hypothetical protein
MTTLRNFRLLDGPDIRYLAAIILTGWNEMSSNREAETANI